MKDLFTIKTCRPIRTPEEYQEISEKILAIWEPFSREIQRVCAKRFPRMMIHKDGSIEHQWDAPTQTFIDRMTEMARYEVRNYLLRRGIAL